MGLPFPSRPTRHFGYHSPKKLFREKAPDRIELDYDPQISWYLSDTPGIRPDLWATFDALHSIPTLVIRGDITDVLMTSIVAEMQRRKPDLVIASVRCVGHAPFMTEDDAWRALREFLTGD